MSRYLDNKRSDRAFVFLPGVFDVFSMVSLRSDLCPPEQKQKENQPQTLNTGVQRGFVEVVEVEEIAETLGN